MNKLKAVYEWICEKFRNALNTIGSDPLTFIFLVIFLISYVLNAVKSLELKLDIEQLKGMYMTFRGADLFKFATDSVFNSHRGETPGASPQVTKGDGTNG